MDVILYAGAGGLADINTDIEPVGMHRLRKELLRRVKEAYKVRYLLLIEFREAADVPVRDDHHMAVVVGIEVEDGKAVPGPRDYIILSVFSQLGLGAKNAALQRVHFSDVFGSPRRP
jgi:hypothetical protein